ncbi:MAG: UDP-N-acetylglucosamine 2-epimerase (non-hydrolyzing) [Bacteroidales bacterium]|nr:UDP-N-acetylglucosamine 2-epimerase (non-hydrolyzing) [Bacteroidales bacterium]MCF8403001.1 UDP-N-acetylglucosamine 2-epimerase (non-hydrolyzing) [Bacteroidales bacterium]
MKKILTIVGARPQFIKAAAISRAIKNSFSAQLQEIIVHTGQHYDDTMSQVFFDEMQIPKPDYNLTVGSASHAVQTALMIEKLESVILKEKPDFVLVYGDTNSTLAGAVAASKIPVPLVHIEAGLRSFNKKMPEEINRIVCDHLSTLLFTPTLAGLNNLIGEGFNVQTKPPFTADRPGVFHCGDIMYDNSLYFSEVAESKSVILKSNDLEPGHYILCTIHRDFNTDDPLRLNSIFTALNQITADFGVEIVLPLHPRTSGVLIKHLSPELYKATFANPKIKIIPPASFFDILVLEKNCKMVMTDSGGVQKEAYFFKKPVIILRPETEWVEIVENGCGIICNADLNKIKDAFQHFSENQNRNYPSIFGNGNAAEFICRKMIG